MAIGTKTEKPTFAVMGAGCGGTAMAGHLALAGYDVALYNRSRARISSFQGRGCIKLRGKIEGVGKLSYIGSDLGRANLALRRQGIRGTFHTDASLGYNPQIAR